jgi:hypothetical protein
VSAPRLIIEHRYTRDAHVPLHAGDEELKDGHQCIPVPPVHPEEEHWEICDTRHEKGTTWRRIYWGVP